METEYGDAWVDKADENSQRLETYNAMHQTKDSEREAKEQITEHINNYARNGGRRQRKPCENLSEIEFVEPKVEDKMLSVKMRFDESDLLEAKFGDDAAENLEQSSKSFPIYETPETRKKAHQVMKGAKCERGRMMPS